jgi:hypothetical protein
MPLSGQKLWFGVNEFNAGRAGPEWSRLNRRQQFYSSTAGMEHRTTFGPLPREDACLECGQAETLLPIKNHSEANIGVSEGKLGASVAAAAEAQRALDDARAHAADEATKANETRHALEARAHDIDASLAGKAAALDSEAKRRAAAAASAAALDLQLAAARDAAREQVIRAKAKAEGLDDSVAAARDAKRRKGCLKSCGACHLARYCSSKCQKANWKKHKEECKSIAAACSSEPTAKSEAMKFCPACESEVSNASEIKRCSGLSPFAPAGPRFPEERRVKTKVCSFLTGCFNEGDTCVKCATICRKCKKLSCVLCVHFSPGLCMGCAADDDQVH